MADIFRQATETLSNLGHAAMDTASNVAKSTLGEELSYQHTEWQREYNWEIVFPFSMGRVPGMAVSKYCSAIAFGDYNFKEVFEQQRGPKSLFTPGTLTIQEVTAVFLVPVPNLLYGYFAAWKDLIVNRDGFYSEQGHYKRPIYIRMYTTQGTTSGTIKLVGCFPKTFFRYELSYEKENIVRYTITFSIDDIEFSGMDVMTSIPRVLKQLF
jgi:hypothetical protein